MKKTIFFLSLFLFGFNTHYTDNQEAFNHTVEDLQLFLPDDLEATLWAESPLFFNPTNIDIDSRGRMWVTEAVNYRNFNNDSTQFYHHQKGDRVVILEDTNQDGKADKSTVFVEDKDLIAPLGIAVMGNKIIVSCAPNLIIYTDENGDDKPDKKEILLTGFGGKDHDHSLHSVVAGADGNWYFNVGNAGSHVVTDKSGWTLRSGSIYTGGSPYNEKNMGNQKSDDGKVYVGGLQFRMKPDGTKLKVLAHNFRNSYETCVDSYGNLWQNDNDDQVVTCRVSWLVEGGNAGFFSEDGTRYWQADQRPDQDMFTAHWHQEDPRIMPAGDNTGAGSPTGIVLNEGDGLGEKYRGMLLSADAGRNVIFGYKPQLKGSGYELKGHRTNFITSAKEDDKGYVWNDKKHDTDLTKWFRPSDVAVGTDGALYVADWYDAVVGGHQMKDLKSYGRIYRITPKNKKLTAPKIDLSTTVGQIEALKNPAVNVRNQGFEALKKQGKKAIKPVKELLTSPNPYHQARAIWLLANLGEKGGKEVEKITETTENEQLKTTAFKALRSVYSDEKLLLIMEKLSNSSSDFLKREILLATQNFPAEKTKYFFEKLNYKGNDPYLLHAIGVALQGKEEIILASEIQKISTEKGKATWESLIFEVICTLHPKSAITILKEWASNFEVPFAKRKKAITALAFIKDKQAVEAMFALSKSKLKDVSEQANYWLAFRQTNDWYDLADWKNTGIDIEKEKKIAQMNALKSLILDEYIRFGDREYQAKQMAKDPIGGQMLISLVARKLLPQDLVPAIEGLIFDNPDQAVRVQASQYFKRAGAEKTYSIAAITNLSPDVVAGKTIFQRSCASCHKVGKTGSEIGPEMTQIKQKFDKLGLLDAIINPNAAIVFGYEPYMVNTKSGEVIYGFLVADGDKTITIKDIGGKKHTIATQEITSKQKQEKGLMPDPSTLGLSEQNLADLSAYLLSLEKE